MTGRDRIVVVASPSLAVLAAVWLLAVAPEREKAAKLATEVSTAQRQLTSAESQVESAARRAGAVSDRLRLDRQPRQSRPGRSGSALADLPARAGDEREERRIHLDHLRRLRRVEPEQPRFEASAATGQAPPRARPPRLRAPASRRCRSRSSSTAASTASNSLFQQLDGFAQRTTAGDVLVSGRLLTVQSVKLAPGRSSGSASTGSGKQQRTLRPRSPRPPTCSPPVQSLTGGATPAGPAGTPPRQLPREPRAPPTPRPWSR